MAALSERAAASIYIMLFSWCGWSFTFSFYSALLCYLHIVMLIDIIGWLDCPGQGHAIGYIIPSKVPLGENFSDLIVPGKRYSLRQVIHQQRALAREVSLHYDVEHFAEWAVYFWNALCFLPFGMYLSVC